jgi:uncharacterized membrane protein
MPISVMGAFSDDDEAEHRNIAPFAIIFSAIVLVIVTWKSYFGSSLFDEHEHRISKDSNVRSKFFMLG